MDSVFLFIDEIFVSPCMNIANIEGYGILKILTDFSIFFKESYNVGQVG